MATQRQDEPQIARMDLLATVEDSLITRPDVHRPDVPANAQPGEDRVPLVVGRVDVEEAIREVLVGEASAEVARPVTEHMPPAEVTLKNGAAPE